MNIYANLYLFQIRKLRRELEQAQEKVLTLTSQLSTNVSRLYSLPKYF